MHRGNHGGGATPWAHTTRHVERVHLRTISETVTHTTETVYVATSVHQVSPQLIYFQSTSGTAHGSACSHPSRFCIRGDRRTKLSSRLLIAIMHSPALLIRSWKSRTTGDRRERVTTSQSPGFSRL